MSGEDKQSKTEKPTQQKLKKAREEGQVARSAELGSWASILAASLLFPLYIGFVMGRVAETFSTLQALPTQPTTADLGAIIEKAFVDLAVVSIVPLAVALGIGVVMSLSQTGFVYSPKALKPKMSNLSWKKGLKKTFSKKTVWESAKQTLRLSAVAAVSIPIVISTVRELVKPGTTLGSGFDVLVDRLSLMLQIAALTGFLLSLLDFAFQKRTTTKDLMMTKHEIKQESKNSEGDPMVKARRRQIAMAMSANRALATLSESTVLVVNPVHFAVALHYDKTIGIPVVTAKGADERALAMRDEALAASVPVVECVPLARKLHRVGRRGKPVPAELYGPVAVLIAFTQKLGNKRGLPVIHQLRIDDDSLVEEEIQ